MTASTLDSLVPGCSCVISSLNTSGSMRRRFQDIGLIEGTVVHCVGVSPCGDPAAYMIRGAVIAIRKQDCRNIFIEIIDKGENVKGTTQRS